MASKILIATPDVHVAGALAEAFAQKGAMPTVAFNAAQFVRFVESEQFHLVTFDQRIADEARPNLVRFALEQTTAAVLGLRSSADGAFLDSLGLPSQVPADTPPGEIATAGTLLIGIAPEIVPAATLSWQMLELDTGRREGFWDGQPLHLTKLQFRVLTALVQAEGNVVTCERLSRVVYGDAIHDDGERMLAHIRRIRRKIEPVPSRPRYLLTVRGEGFRLAKPVESLASS